MSTSPSGRIAIYPGTFDPLTNGHVDIIQRGAALFDRIIVAILVNSDKSPLFSVEERLGMARAVFAPQPRVEIDTFDGLLVDYAQQRQAKVIVRGLRAISDFEFEMQMALMNRHLQPDTEILFMMASLNCVYVSSSRLKELARFGAAIDDFVPASVARRLREKLGP